jgi:hypothetical protein
MLEHYRHQRWDMCEQTVRSLIGEFDGGLDEYYGIWLDRIQEMKSKNLPQDWDCVYVATSK